jgi:glycosyltransferase involved in cell wall biosynthesis
MTTSIAERSLNGQRPSDTAPDGASTAASPPAAVASAPLSVCMVSDDFLPGATGVGTHVQTVSRHLAARGHRVTVITTRRPGEPEREQWQGVSVHRVPTIRVAGFDQAVPASALLAELLTEAQPDIVHQHYLGLMMLRTIKVCERLGLPQIYTYHMTEDHLTQPWFMRPWRGLIARQILRSVNRMDAVISVSAGIAATLPGKGITPPVTVISNPVDFPDPTTVTPAARDGDFIVMYAGRLEPEKNLTLLLRGFAILAKQHPRALLWIAGRGSQQAALEALARAHGVASQVRFLGFLGAAELASRYAACDVFVLPSWVETQGLVALEAMWFGKPVLVSKAVASASDLVDDGINGWQIDAVDPADLARRLAGLNPGSPGTSRTPTIDVASKLRSLRLTPAAVLHDLVAAYRRSLGGRGTVSKIFTPPTA